jgi:aminomethyltransferase
MVPFSGYEMPLQYPLGMIAEHHHTRNHAGLFDISYMGVISIPYSKDSIEILEQFIPSEIKELSVGQTRYGLLLNENGGILDDLMITRFTEYFLLVVNAERKEADYRYFSRFLNCTLFNDVGLIALQGPKARSVMAKIFPETKELPFMKSIIKGKGWISCCGYTGEDGFEIILPKDEILELAKTLLSYEVVKPIGLGARDSLRLEAGLCLYGHDLNNAINPVEASLTWSIGMRRRREGRFLDSDVILDELANLKQKDRGPKIRRVGLTASGEIIAREGAQIYSKEDVIIGEVTSGVPSPTLGYPIAMGYVKSDYANYSTEVFVEIRGQRYPFVITSMPFVAHKYYRG